MIPADFHLEARYHYTRHSPIEQELYRFLLDCQLNQQYRFFFSVSEDRLPTEEEYRDIPRFICEDISSVNLFAVLESIRLDCPELYYTYDLLYHYDIDRCLFTASIEEVDYSLDGPIEYPTAVAYTPEEIAELNTALDAIIHRFDGITDEFELELAVHDFATKSYDYEHNEEALTGQEKNEIFTVAGLIKRGRGVCAAFAALIQLVLQRHGVFVANVVAPAMSEESEEPSDIYHAWLVVRIDGEYYHLDVTFNEGNTLDPELPQYTQFNITDGEVRRDHIFPAEDFPELVCTATAANYYRRRGLYFTSTEEVEAAVREFCRRAEGCGCTRYFYFRVPEEMDEAAVRDAVIRASRWAVITYRSLCLLDMGYCAVTLEFPAY